MATGAASSDADSVSPSSSTAAAATNLMECLGDYTGSSVSSGSSSADGPASSSSSVSSMGDNVRTVSLHGLRERIPRRAGRPTLVPTVTAHSRAHDIAPASSVAVAQVGSSERGHDTSHALSANCPTQTATPTEGTGGTEEMCASATSTAAVIRVCDGTRTALDAAVEAAIADADALLRSRVPVAAIHPTVRARGQPLNALLSTSAAVNTATSARDDETCKAATYRGRSAIRAAPLLTNAAAAPTLPRPRAASVVAPIPSSDRNSAGRTARRAAQRSHTASGTRLPTARAALSSGVTQKPTLRLVFERHDGLPNADVSRTHTDENKGDVIALQQSLHRLQRQVTIASQRSADLAASLVEAQVEARRSAQLRRVAETLRRRLAHAIRSEMSNPSNVVLTT